MRRYGDYVALCDVDQNRRDLAGEIVKQWTGAQADVVANYRAIIDREDIDIVHISTPDHWHAKIAIEAMLAGRPIEELKSKPLPPRSLESVYKNRPLVDHFRNFFEAAASREEPVSDVYSHHRALSTCHLAGIAARLGRKIHWNPHVQRTVGDQQAQDLVARTPRQGFETEA